MIILKAAVIFRYYLCEYNDIHNNIFRSISMISSVGECSLQFDEVWGPETCDLLSPESANIESGKA